MNLILIEPHELDPTATVTLADHRARHLLRVLKVNRGDSVRIGIIDGARGHAEVVDIAPATVTLRCRYDDPGPELGSDILLLAFARPKVVLRCLEHATALGFGKIVLFRSRRVEKSHLSSHALTPETLDEHIRRGLEQSRRTFRPSVVFVPRFRQLIEVELERLVPMENRFVADPDTDQEAALAELPAKPLSVVIGPEGGLIDHELEQFSRSGFRLVSAGDAPLRVETAVAYLTGQLRAARSRSQSSSA